MAATTLLTDANTRWVDVLRHGMESYLKSLSSVTDQATNILPMFRGGATADIQTLMTEVGQTWVSTMEQVGDSYVKAVSIWSELCATGLPTLSALPTPASLPDPEALIDAAFDVADRLVAVERTCAHNVLEAMAPLSDKFTTGPPAQPGVKAHRAGAQKSATEPAARAPSAT